MEILFACGHRQMVTGDAAPVCVCGETRVRRVEAPPPTFRGVARGPLVEHVPLEAVRLDLASVPLQLKESE
jgi:hypothetical protein